MTSLDAARHPGSRPEAGDGPLRPGFARRHLDLGDPSGGRLAALSFGPRERPVDGVFLHANGFNARAYRFLLEPLADAWHWLACDQRGHGGTTLPAEPAGRLGWDDLAHDLVAVLDRLDGPPVVLVGHSMGGTASLLATALRPDRVRRLVLLDPVILTRTEIPPPGPLPDAPGQGAHSRLVEGALRRRETFPSREEALATYRGRGAFKTWPEAALADYVADGFRDRPDGSVELACPGEWEASNFRAQGHETWGALRRLARPAHILRAETGSTCALATPPSSLVTVETVPGTTHFLPFERPEAVRAAIRQAMAAATSGTE